jgi:hypothetical protein
VHLVGACAGSGCDTRNEGKCPLQRLRATPPRHSTTNTCAQLVFWMSQVCSTSERLMYTAVHELKVSASVVSPEATQRAQWHMPCAQCEHDTRAVLHTFPLHQGTLIMPKWRPTTTADVSSKQSTAIARTLNGVRNAAAARHDTTMSYCVGPSSSFLSWPGPQPRADLRS